jgi:hypothetical protein
MLEPTDWTEQKMSTNWELWSLVTWSFISIVLIISRRWNFIIVYLEFVWKSLTLSAIFQHSALLDLDKDTSFFGVFDGHGGKVNWEDHHLSLPTIFSTWYQNGHWHHHTVITFLPQEKWLPNSAQNIYTEKFSKVKAIQLVTWVLLSIELSSGIENC